MRVRVGIHRDRGSNLYGGSSRRGYTLFCVSSSVSVLRHVCSILQVMSIIEDFPALLLILFGPCSQVLASLRTAHSNGESQMGVDVDGDSICDKVKEGVVDLMSTKESALRLAVDAAVTVLRVRCRFDLCRLQSPRFRNPRNVEKFVSSSI